MSVTAPKAEKIVHLMTAKKYEKAVQSEGTLTAVCFVFCLLFKDVFQKFHDCILRIMFQYYVFEGRGFRIVDLNPVSG